MEEADLTQGFFSWLEVAETRYNSRLQFEAASRGVLKFLLDDYVVTLNLSQSVFAYKNSKQQKWTDWCQSRFNACAPDISASRMLLSAFLDEIVEKYEEREAGGEEEEVDAGSYGSDEEEIDYKEDILAEDVERPVTQVSNHISLAHTAKKRVIDDLSDVSDNHFVFRHAEEAKMLVDTWLHQDPELAYSVKLSVFQGIAMVKLELDLSFLDLSKESLDMLGFTLDELLTVNLSYRRGTLVDTAEFTGWTSRLLKDVEIECLQGARVESFGCKEYVPGLVKAFFAEINQRILSSEENVRVPGEHLEDFTSWDVKVASATVESLVEMGYSRADSLRALQESAGNLDLAVESLLNMPQKRPKVVKESAMHWIQDLSANVWYNLLFSLREALMECTHLCIFCYKKHAIDSFRLRACMEDICEFRFDEIAGFSVFAELKNHLQSVHTDISIAAIAANSARAINVFEPFPSFLLFNRQIRGKSGFLSRDVCNYTPDMDKNKNIDSLKQLISHIPSPQWLLDASTDEKSLQENIQARCQGGGGREVYKMLRFIVATNRLMVQQLTGTQRIPDFTGDIEQFVVTSHSPETMRIFNESKAEHGSFFAFHGSSIENWYSIIRNGLRNMSSSHMMTAGAAYGAGIYAAENMATSLGYCGYNSGQYGHIWQHCNLDNKHIMAIIEVVNKNEYKHGGIYVIPNDKDVIIRYLLIFSQGMGTSCDANQLKLETHLAAFEAKFTEERLAARKTRIQAAIAKAKAREDMALRAEAYFRQQQAERAAPIQPPAEVVTLAPAVESKLKALEMQLAGQGSVAATKRLLNEYRYLSASKECTGISVAFERENLYIWLVSLDMNQFEVPQELKRDFTAYAQHTKRPMMLEFEVRFGHNFPFSPPFLRIVRPRFAFHTGHVTVGGSICMQSLTSSGWIPVRTVESVFIEILFNMGEGGARLDLSRLGQDYSLEEAEEAFTRVAKQHNWL
jgi:ubiquitin-protein ligase